MFILPHGHFGFDRSLRPPSAWRASEAKKTLLEEKKVGESFHFLTPKVDFNPPHLPWGSQKTEPWSGNPWP